MRKIDKVVSSIVFVLTTQMSWGQSVGSPTTVMTGAETPPENTAVYINGNSELFKGTALDIGTVSSFGIKFVSKDFLSTVLYKNNALLSQEGDSVEFFAPKATIDSDAPHSLSVFVANYPWEWHPVKSWRYDRWGFYGKFNIGFSAWKFVGHETESTVETDVIVPATETGVLYRLLYWHESASDTDIEIVFNAGISGRGVTGDISQKNLIKKFLGTSDGFFPGVKAGAALRLNNFTITTAIEWNLSMGGNWSLSTSPVYGLTGTTWRLSGAIDGDFFRLFQIPADPSQTPNVEPPTHQ